VALGLAPYMYAGARYSAVRFLLLIMLLLLILHCDWRSRLSDDNGAKVRAKRALSLSPAQWAGSRWEKSACERVGTFGHFWKSEPQFGGDANELLFLMGRQLMQIAVLEISQ
jgi:hypothetical protein